MNLAAVQRVFGVLLMAFSLTMLPPAAVSLAYSDGEATSFLASFLLLAVGGVALWWPVHRVQRDLRRRDGALIVALFWMVLGMAGALPLLLNEGIDLGFTDAAFEAMSGLTTTG